MKKLALCKKREHAKILDYKMFEIPFVPFCAHLHFQRNKIQMKNIWNHEYFFMCACASKQSTWYRSLLNKMRAYFHENVQWFMNNQPKKNAPILQTGARKVSGKRINFMKKYINSCVQMRQTYHLHWWSHAKYSALIFILFLIVERGGRCVRPHFALLDC